MDLVRNKNWSGRKERAPEEKGRRPTVPLRVNDRNRGFVYERSEGRGKEKVGLVVNGSRPPTTGGTGDGA